MMARLTSHDRNERPDAEEVLDAFEEMVGRTTTTAEHELGRLVSEAARSKADKAPDEDDRDEPQGNGCAPNASALRKRRSRSPGGEHGVGHERRGRARPRHREARDGRARLSDRRP